MDPSRARTDLGSRTRNILTSGAIYGIADLLVLLVGGFLLLPLYTHALSQADYGRFVAVKANLELLSTVLHFGLVSAAARVYFDHRRDGVGGAFMGCVLALFIGVLLVALLLLMLGGHWAWAQLSPQVPADPFLVYCLVIAVAAFLSALGTTWIRLDEQALAFALTQLLAAAVLAAAAYLALRVFSLGLPGVLLAMLLSSAVGALALLAKFGLNGIRAWPRGTMRETLHYALPVVAGLLAYFVLNRANTLLLQRHVPVEELAVFGLAQQLALLVGIASTAFGKAMQPAVWGAPAEQAGAMMERLARLLLAVMLAVCTTVLLFAADIVRWVAPASYAGAHPVLLLLVLATFVYALSLASDTVLLQHRRPRLSAAVSIGGALLATLLGLWLVPRWGAPGAAAAMLLAYAMLTLCSYLLARQLGGPHYLLQMLGAWALATGVAAMAWWLQLASLAPGAVWAIRLSAWGGLLCAIFLACRRARLFGSESR